MKIILLEDIENVGKKYEVKEVKDGHARNFLIPKKLVKLATKESLKWLESQKEVIEKEVKEDLEKAQGLASKLDGLDINIEVKVGEKDELFESIDSTRIVKELKQQGFEVKKSQVSLKKPIKELGEFQVKVNLKHNLEAEIKVIVSPISKGDAED